MRHISARPAPLPPSSGFIPPLPSVFVLPKRYTYLPLGLGAWALGLDFLLTLFVAIGAFHAVTLRSRSRRLTQKPQRPQKMIQAFSHVVQAFRPAFLLERFPRCHQSSASRPFAGGRASTSAPLSATRRPS